MPDYANYMPCYARSMPRLCQLYADVMPRKNISSKKHYKSMGYRAMILA